MANAGCINAIGFDGTYLRTLQCLDSSNIGVGVQYTAPNPLDDKRFDYITYTDKCGCQCCLTDENEILIYATQGVIKNLTLTNDDTNEAIIVKWTDLFGSNRAKTVVRYKTGSYPSSPTDGTLAVEETTQNQYQTNGYSVFGLTDGTTYYFSVFALDGDDTTINVQSMSITTDFLRAKYQKIEYATNNGSGTYFDTQQKALTNTRVEIKFNIVSRTSSKEQRAIAIWDSYEQFRCGFESTGAFESKYGFTCTPNIALNTIIVGTGATANVTTGYNQNSPYNMYMFAQNESNTVKHNGTGNIRIYYCKLREGDTQVREFRPCIRKSDNVVGFLDTITKTFYSGSGGNLVAGPNV